MNLLEVEARMARSIRRARVYRDRLVRLLARGPTRPSELGFRAWLGVLRRTMIEFFEDELNDRAASLTYYSIMSIFPGLLVLMAGVGLLGSAVTDDIIGSVGDLAPGPARDIIVQAITDLQTRPATSVIVGIVALALAFWSATGYIGGFMRAANAIYDVPEARPLWKTIPIQLLVTAVTTVGFAISALAVVITGRFADWAGRAIGVEKQVVLVFNIVKWPVLVILVLLLISLLYWISPNARQGGFRWITPGSVLAVIGIAAVTTGLATYIAMFDTYNRTYGTIGGVIVVLVWLWLTNIAILVGAELDAELSRARAILAGLPKDAEPYLPLRDLPKLPEVPLAGHHPELDNTDPEEKPAPAI